MKNSLAVFFDMFFTLADPCISPETDVSDCVGMTPEEWSGYFWNSDIARRRGLGVYRTPEEIIDAACSLMPVMPADCEKAALTAAQKEKMRRSLVDVRPDILRMLKALKAAGARLCVISNADVIDICCWDESPLREYFDAAIFSCDCGFLKPGPEIYNLGIEAVGGPYEKMYFVGDGGDGELAGAKSAGMTAVLARYLKNRGSAADMGADFAADSPEDVVQIILHDESMQKY